MAVTTTESRQDEERFAEVLNDYFPQGGWRLRRGSSGMNNTTRFVEAGGEAYVLRIYETHRDADKVAYEHRVLLALAGMALPFRTPVPVRAANGETVVRIGESQSDGLSGSNADSASADAASAGAASAGAASADAGSANAASAGVASADAASADTESADAGKIAALFRYMEGVNPVLDSPAAMRAFGVTAGRLSRALADVTVEADPVYRPYYELDQTHPHCTHADVAGFCADPPEEFGAYADALDAVGRQLASVRSRLNGLRALPHQLVHGDLNASNCLADPATGEVSAVLDFEFVTRDLRVMEPAVCLAEVIDPSRSDELIWPEVEAFLGGFGETIRLGADELAAIPTLLMLRRLDVFIHFLGRYRSGLDSAPIVADQIGSAFASARWLAGNGERLVAVCTKRLGIPYGQSSAY